METIVKVAIKIGGQVYALGPPARHHNVIRMLEDSMDLPIVPDVQGFVTSTGQFVNRLVAYQIAEAAGQIKGRDRPGSYQGPLLFSEDLW